MDNNWGSIMFKSVSVVSLFEMFNLAIVQTKTSYNLQKSGNPNLLGNFFIIFDIFNQYCLIILKSPNKNSIYSHTEDALHLLWGLKKWNYTITTTSVSSSAPFCEMTSSSSIFDLLKFVHFSFWFKGWISEFFFWLNWKSWLASLFESQTCTTLPVALRLMAFDKACLPLRKASSLFPLLTLSFFFVQWPWHVFLHDTP